MASRREKPDSSRPQLYFRDAAKPWDPDDYLTGVRLRIFYPGGKSQWYFAGLAQMWDETCWSRHSTFNEELNEWFGVNQSMTEAKRAAREYDAIQGAPSMRFICNL